MKIVEWLFVVLVTMVAFELGVFVGEGHQDSHHYLNKAAIAIDMTNFEAYSIETKSDITNFVEKVELDKNYLLLYEHRSEAYERHKALFDALKEQRPELLGVARIAVTGLENKGYGFTEKSMEVAKFYIFNEEQKQLNK